MQKAEPFSLVLDSPTKALLAHAYEALGSQYVYCMESMLCQHLRARTHAYKLLWCSLNRYRKHVECFTRVVRKSTGSSRMSKTSRSCELLLIVHTVRR